MKVLPFQRMWGVTVVPSALSELMNVFMITIKYIACVNSHLGSFIGLGCCLFFLKKESKTSPKTKMCACHNPKSFYLFACQGKSLNTHRQNLSFRQEFKHLKISTCLKANRFEPEPMLQSYPTYLGLIYFKMQFILQCIQ